MPKHSRSLQERSYQVLDPRTLGRPVHLLHRFTALLREDFDAYFQQQLNRRYRARFQIGEVSLVRVTNGAGLHRGVSVRARQARINVAIERGLLLGILEYRYGVNVGTHEQASTDAPETATEERLQSRLGHQLAALVVNRIDSIDPPGPAQLEDQPCEIAGAPMRGGWSLQVPVSDTVRGVSGCVWMQLEESWIDRLLNGLAPRLRGDASKSKSPSAEPLAMSLNLQLAARLLEKQVQLGTVLDLRPGDVVPITLGHAEVLVDDSRLFTASVAEHKGKLCLTSFVDLE